MRHYHKKTSFVVTPRAEALARSLLCTPARLMAHAAESIRQRPIPYGNTLIWMVFALPGRACEFSLIPSRGAMVVDQADWPALSAMDDAGMRRRLRR